MLNTLCPTDVFDELLIVSVVTIQGVELTEDQVELPDEPVTSPKQITVYVTVCELALTT